MPNYGAYVRASTSEQTDDHQRSSINEWIQEHDVDDNQVEWYVDLNVSGARDDREHFQRLLEDVEAGQLDYVICWEISRISRTGATLQEFFDTCEKQETTIVITDGAVEKVTPDGQGRFVADIIGMVYQQERRTLIRRIEGGMRTAREEGKWLGQVPLGFRRREDGRLQPIIDPEEDEVGYLELRGLLKELDAEKSYRQAEKEVATTRQALMRVHQDDERRRWYLDAEAEDDRVSAALDAVRTS